MNKLSFIPKALLPSTITTRKIVQSFAERSGMVYFGFVSQRDDDHHILRGLTVSTKHTDDHYCIGTYEGYDVLFVERSDTLQSGKKHIWHIMEFDLKTEIDIPHAFVDSGKHGKGFHELLSVKYATLQKVAMGSSAAYPSSFTANLNVYVNPANQIYLEHLLTPQVCTMIASHFKGLVIEVSQQALYIYSEKSHVSESLLDAMLQNGHWLAEQLDINSRQQFATGSN